MTEKILGLDLDNTIVSYEPIFRMVAEERRIPIPHEVSVKNALRDHYYRLGQPDEFTGIQGFCYGRGMVEAEPHSSFLASLERILASGWKVWVVSHRTRRPIFGEEADLHAAALNWLRRIGLLVPGPYRIAGIFLEETRLAKITRIRSLGCSVFVDDLLEVLQDQWFPRACRPLWFFPGHPPSKECGIDLLSHWSDLPALS